jgi:hypothetical protein
MVEELAVPTLYLFEIGPTLDEVVLVVNESWRILCQLP